jgi:hypothetical protein
MLCNEIPDAPEMGISHVYMGIPRGTRGPYGNIPTSSSCVGERVSRRSKKQLLVGLPSVGQSARADFDGC